MRKEKEHFSTSTVSALNLEPTGATAAPHRHQLGTSTRKDRSRLDPAIGTSGLAAINAAEGRVRIVSTWDLVNAAKERVRIVSAGDIVSAEEKSESSGTNSSGWDPSFLVLATQTQEIESCCGSQLPEKPWHPIGAKQWEKSSGTQLAQSSGTQLAQSSGTQAMGLEDWSEGGGNATDKIEHGINRNVQYLLQGGSSAQCLAPGQIGAHGNRMEAQDFIPRVEERTPKDLFSQPSRSQIGILYGGQS